MTLNSDSLIGEHTKEPIHSSLAHVFQIDPETRKSWLPLSKQAVLVSFYHDSVKGTYKILAIENSKPLINSTISSTMSFTKTSQKFGQWSDPRANTVYGLGFQSESDLRKFYEIFKEAKKAIKALSASSKPIAQANMPDTLNVNGTLKNRSTTSTGSVDDDIQSPGSHRSSSSSSELQMKYENDRLKAALAQSSANAKKWEAEFQTLKNNNARLTAALQESTANVDKWKEQLSNYKEENARLRKKHIDGGGDISVDISGSSRELEHLLHDCEVKLKRKEEEVIRLSQHGSGELNLLREKNSELQQKLQDSESQVRELRITVQTLEEKVKTLKLSETKLRQINDVRVAMEEKTRELSNLQGRMSSLLK